MLFYVLNLIYLFIDIKICTRYIMHLLQCHSGCLDMVAIEGQFTFTAERPQLNCAVFFIGEPSDIISIEYDSVNIDCRGGDFIKVNDHSYKSNQTQISYSN